MSDPQLVPDPADDPSVDAPVDPPDPAIDALVAACTGSTIPPGRHSKVATKLVGQVLRRRRWALHRHVHLVAAFEDARARGPIERVLAVGCGAGLSELFLAVSNPHIEFTLSDYDDARVDVPRRWAAAHGIDNVTFRTLDLLAEPGDERYDLVSSIEVLEHIDDDAAAAAHMLALTRRFLYVLVPFATPETLANPEIRARAWEHHEHHRPGYSHETLWQAFSTARPLWMRNAYYQPAARELRDELTAASDEELLADPRAWVRRVAPDVRDQTGGHERKPSGIELLSSVTRLPAPGTHHPPPAFPPKPPPAPPAPPPAPRWQRRLRRLAGRGT